MDRQKQYEDILDELITLQQEKMLKLACKIVPQVTLDDLLQPQDFPELEYHPFFRYEEGVLEGILSAKAAFFQVQKQD